MRKSIVALFVLSAVLWLGTSIARLIVAFDAFTPGTTVLKPSLTDVHLLQTVWLFTLLGGWCGWLFAASVVLGIGVVVLRRSQFKTQGWLLMCTILAGFIVPLQAWLIVQDIRLWDYFDASSGLPLAPSNEILDVFLLRVTNVTSSVCAGLSALLAITIVFVASWHPLTNRAAGENES